MKVDVDELVFSTGKRIYAHLGIIGIDSELIISEGYDGGIDDDEFTASERAELADYAIELWRQYKGVK